MALTDTLLPEFDREMGLTRRVLDRVPDAHFEFRPHPTCVTLGRLAEHLCDLAHWAAITMNESSFAMTTDRPAGYVRPATRDAVLALFDANLKNGRAAVAGKTDAEFAAPWKLTSGGKEVFTMPKAAVMRNFVLNHMIHHRGQMLVYLRMLGVSIPSIYGPSGDEKM